MVNVVTHRYPQVKFHSLTTFCTDYRVWVVPSSQCGNISFFSAADVFLLHSLELETRPFSTPSDQSYQYNMQRITCSTVDIARNEYGSNRKRRIVLCDILYVFSSVMWHYVLRVLFLKPRSFIILLSYLFPFFSILYYKWQDTCCDTKFWNVSNNDMV